MITKFPLRVSFLIFVMCLISSNSFKNDLDKYEEYIIEHEISSVDAKKSAMNIDLDSIVTPIGCQKCTSDELKYCRGRDLINDHCCCDKRYSETLPFVPHTCYFGPILCHTIAKDCAEYSRLRKCCCNKYILPIYQDISSNASAKIYTTNIFQFTLNNFMLYLLCKQLIL